jgi:2-phospho-L-lactate guanylyltransferase
MGMKTIAESIAGDLNAALVQGMQLLAGIGAEAVLILPADVPLVDVESIEAIVGGSSAPASLGICPARDRDGTNALLIRPPGAISPSFGPGSFQRHVALGRARGLDVSVLQSDSLGLDIDEPDDLEIFLTADRSTHTRAALRERVSR